MNRPIMCRFFSSVNVLIVGNDDVALKYFQLFHGTENLHGRKAKSFPLEFKFSPLEFKLFPLGYFSQSHNSKK